MSAPQEPPSCEELSRRLDAHHDASRTGQVQVCALCGVTTSGEDHDVQPDERQRAALYLARFEVLPRG